MSIPASDNQAEQSAGPSIAIIGTEGSGKTVLAAVLAGHLRSTDARGVFLNPQGVATMRYVERVWQTLQEGDWPASTPPGELFELKWKLEMLGGPESRVRLIDAAGQDLRLLFGEEKIHQAEDLPESLRKLAAYCRSADIVLFLINLKDFEGQADPLRRTDNEAAIKIAMDYFSSDGRRRRFCVLFTQADLYRETAMQHGGWPNLAAEMIPYCSRAYLQSVQLPMSRRVPVFPVSAVNRTRIVVDEQGVPRRVPDPPFGSDGLDAVVEWLTTQVRELHRPEVLPVKPPPLPPPVDPPWWTWLKENWRGLAAGLLGVMMVRSCTGGCGLPPSRC